MAVSDVQMHHMLNILTFTFIQGHTDLSREDNKYLIISETILFLAMPIKFAVKIVWLKSIMTIARPTTLTFIEGHQCVSNLTAV